MLGLLAAMLGGFPFYAGSKYFPVGYRHLKGRLPAWSGVFFLLLSQGIYVVKMGPAIGLLAGFLAVSLAYSLLVFVFHLPRQYFRLFWGVIVIFLILDLVF